VFEMKKRPSHIVVVCILLAIVAPVAHAKHKLLKPLAPVEADGVRYTAEGDGRDQYVAATDISSGKRLWKVKAFHTRILNWIFWREEDTQWIFITDLKLLNRSLFVRNEKSRCYSIDLTTHKVRKASCSLAFPEKH
jgi:hypothetical protein